MHTYFKEDRMVEADMLHKYIDAIRENDAEKVDTFSDGLRVFFGYSNQEITKIQIETAYELAGERWG